MSSPCLAVASPWTSLAAVYRRWAFLRTLGRTTEAAAFERDQWEPALHAARAEGLDDSDLAALLHAEDERLATATLIADLLAARAPASSSVNPTTPASPATARPLAPPSSHPRIRTHHPAEINIADMIDSMLDDQRDRRSA